MSEDKAESKQKVAWSSIFATVATGLLLAAFNYGFILLATYIFIDRVDLYFVERPISEGKFQKLVVVDNYSSSVINELQFTVTAENAAVSSEVNLEKVEQGAVAPRTLLLKVLGVLPNRQASFILQSGVVVPDESFRFVKGPNGLRYKSKDRLLEAWFDWSQFVSAFIQFLVYVLGMLYFEKQMATILAQGDELKIEINNRKTEIQDAKSLLAKIQQDNLKNKLVQVQRMMNLTKENRLWREVALGILQQTAKDQNAAKKLLSIIFRKAGIKLAKTVDELEDDELLEMIEGAKSRLALTQV